MTPLRERQRPPQASKAWVHRTPLVGVVSAVVGTAFALLVGAPFFGALVGAMSASLFAVLFVLARESRAIPQSTERVVTTRPGKKGSAWRDERDALVETLAAEIAHEVRYPINFFRTIFLRAADSRILDEEDLAIGREEVERLERMVSGLRRAAIQHVDRRVVQVNELLGRVEALLRDRHTDADMIVDVAEQDVIRCDVDKITQVLVNLLANAFDAVDAGGDVGVSFSHRVGGGAELTVWDTGPGFRDEASLFVPWYTTKPRGTGLGLAISHRLVRGHGWTIEAERREGKTLFVVSLPPEDVVFGGGRQAESGKVRLADSARSGSATPKGKDRGPSRKGQVA